MKTLTFIALFGALGISLALCDFEAATSVVFSQSNPKPKPTPKSTTPAKTTNRNSNSGSSESPSRVTVTAPVPGTHDGAITKIRISIQTGEDDLRTNSKFRAFLRTRDDRRIESDPLNCRRVVERETVCIGIPGGTRRTYEWELRTVVVPVYPQDIYTFGLTFETGSTGPFDSGDNWNVDRLEVDYIVTKGSVEKHSPAGTFSLYRNSGSPLYRFKTRDQWETDPLSLPR
jgi:hypothetical protein